MDTIYSALIPDASATKRGTIAQILSAFPSKLLEFVAEAGTTIRPLRIGEKYDAASPALKRLGIDVDAWPSAPAGLFVVEERAVYLRSLSPMTAAHEFGHAIDCALGGGVYHSGVDPSIRRAFAAAKSFVTPYAATGLDEYAAECLRAYAQVNDSSSPWPRATRERLQRVDLAMFAIVESLFARFAPGVGEQAPIPIGGSS